MIIFSKQGKITEHDDKTNIVLEFTVPNGVKKLTVTYSYNPKEVEDKALARKAIANGMNKYGVNFANPEAFMPVKNLVTLSFDENGEYRGACHRQPNNQTVIIAESESTAGIFNRPIQPGKWDVMLNVHFAGCEIDYNIEINGEAE
ncbi:MAG: hypothetical protein ACLUFN_02575 [Eubacterium sp.]